MYLLFPLCSRKLQFGKEVAPLLENRSQEMSGSSVRSRWHPRRVGIDVPEAGAWPESVQYSLNPDSRVSASHG